ncbi:tyrosine-type recombinase/integrase [Carnobacterium maltaromaticum]|uniref:tyrosine-type recombinase/integrase n=1 Tax=Carnobacterium maltaromaticum TaxID=2751 RepID=UPI003B987F0E
MGKRISNKIKVAPYIFEYKDNENEKRYLIRWTYYNFLGQRKEFFKQNIESKTDARMILIQAQSEVTQGNSKVVDYKNIKVIDWFNLWYEAHKNEWKETTRIQRKSAIEKQIAPLVGNYKLIELDKITYKHVFINKLLQQYKPSTVQLMHAIFKISINDAVENEILKRNKFRGIKIPNPEKKIRHLTRDQLQSFITTAKNTENITNYTLLLVLAYSGMRRGECLGLRWSDVDFESKTIKIERTRDNKGVRTPKTLKSYRTILMDNEIILKLKKYQLWCKQLKLSFGIAFKDADFIFISYQNGSEIADNTLKYTCDRVAKVAKIDTVTPHMLRHTHATLLLSAKPESRPSINAVSERLGNTPEMIMNVYAHVLESQNIELVEIFSDVINM